jgi:hypothetical protein
VVALAAGGTELESDTIYMTPQVPELVEEVKGRWRQGGFSYRASYS